MSQDQTRKEILLAAQRLFQEKGLGNITMEDVARSIGKGKSSLYYYFKSKEEIFSAVLEMEINEIVFETIKRVSKANTFQEKLLAFGTSKFEMVKKRTALYAAMELGMKPDEILWYKQLKMEVHIGYLNKEKTILQQIWIDAINNELLPKMDHDEIEKAILLFLCSLRGINRETISTGTQDAALPLIQTLCSLFAK